MAGISIRAAAAIAALCISATASASIGSTAWSNLWWTHDQQGQRLLRSDQPGKAAARFSDPRRRAYADLRAGQYAQAAKLLTPFHDVQSEYNRGNALARIGHLQDALDAYDAALAKAPGDRDTRHNRDLVARALHQSGKQQHGKQQGQQQHNGQQQQQGQHGGTAQQNSGNAQQGGGAGQQAGGPPQQRGGASAGSSTAGQNGNRQQPSQAAAAAAAAAGAAAHANTGRAASAAAPKRESEQALSLEQWLRRIPDDPGGLLRRKFLIEHLMRQRSANQQSANP